MKSVSTYFLRTPEKVRFNEAYNFFTTFYRFHTKLLLDSSYLTRTTRTRGTKKNYSATKKVNVISQAIYVVDLTRLGHRYKFIIDIPLQNSHKFQTLDKYIYTHKKIKFSSVVAFLKKNDTPLEKGCNYVVMIDAKSVPIQNI